MTENREFPHGFNWQCSMCGTYASVAPDDLKNYICPKCKGMGLQSFAQKAVVVPKFEFKPENPLKFKDERFMTGVKKKYKGKGYKKKLKVEPK